MRKDFETKNFIFSFIEHYSQFFSVCNWYTFWPVFWELEDDRSMGAVEMTFVLMGLGFRIRWNYRETEKTRELSRMIADIKD